jgi:hypothetical protein
MGCDIHMYPERRGSYSSNGVERHYWTFVYRYTPDPRWARDTFPRPDRDNYFAWGERWYWLFGQLAGVRRDGPPIVEPRGVPADVSEEAKKDIEDAGSDFHSHSWLSLKELQDHPWEQSHDGSLEAEHIKPVRDWIARLAEIDPDPENVRIVFAFDN